MLRRFASPLLAAAFVLLAMSAVRAEVVTASIVIKDHKFVPSELTVPANKQIVLTVDNQDAQPEEFESHQLKIEKVIPGNSKGLVRIRALEPGRYPFFGEFHEATAQGAVVAK